MLEGKKILIISAHPDDEAICCGGLIMLAKKYRAQVKVLFMAVGLSRQLLTGKTTANQRIPEIKKASKFGNYEYSIKYQGEQFMRLDTVAQKDLIDTIEDTNRAFKPELVCIPFINSFDQDHRAVSQASIAAFRPVPKNLQHQPKIILEYEEPYSWNSGSIFQPNWYFDISKVLDEKLELLKCHKTQLRDDPFPRSQGNLKRLAGLRGAEISTQYAEAYHLIKGQLL